MKKSDPEKHFHAIKNSIITLLLMPKQLAKVMLACLLTAGGGYQMAYAQQSAGTTQTVGSCTGTVLDSFGDPIVGASVFVKGTSIGGATDIDGHFSLAGVKNGATIRISSIGYNPQEVVWRGQPLEITLNDDDNTLDEVVVVGYGVQKKVNLTGAVASVSGDVLNDRPITNIGQGLQGKIGNLIITSNNGGAPGSTSNFNVRGTTSLNGGGPLVLVDNVQMDPNLVNPDDIESVTVLKDAASAAIYGARAAYGVILITTKKGKAGDKPVISFGASGYWAKAVTEVHKVDSYEYLKQINGGNFNDNGTNYFDEITTQHIEDYYFGRIDSPVFVYPGSGDAAAGKYTYCGNTDWWDALYKSSFNQLYNMSISGGTGKTTYYGSFAMTDQGTNRVGADEKYQRFNASLNIDTQLASWLKVGMKMSNAYVTQKHPTGSGNSGVTQMSGTFKNDIRPIMPVYHPDGNYAGQGNFTNPVAVAALGGNTRDRSNDLWITGVAQLTPMKGLFIQADYTWNVYSFNRSIHQQRFMEYGIDGQPLDYYPWTSRPEYNQRNNSNDYYQAFNLFAQYDWTLGEGHNFRVMTGYNQEKKVYGSFSAYRPNILTEDSYMLQYATGDPNVSSSASQWAINSWFGRINYDFQGKYLLELVARYDGTSKFPKGRSNRYGFFPSGSIGWRISEENFWEGLRGWWNNMKIRASYGRLGNQSLDRDTYGDFPYLANYPYSSKIGMILGGTRPVGVGTPGLVSARLTWEKVDQLDLGFDAAFFQNRLTAEFDWYQRDTKGMLTGGQALPSVLGTNVPNENAADLRTNGWELSIGWNDHISSIGLNYYVRGTLADYQAKITKYENPTGGIGSYYVGRKIGEIWGFESNGLFQSEQEIANAADQSFVWGGKWTPGMTRYEDLNGDGEINQGIAGMYKLDGKYYVPGDAGYNDVVNNPNATPVGTYTLENSGDWKIIGNSTPRYTFGITVGAEWKGFDFDMFWQGTGKRDYFTDSAEFFPIAGEWNVPQKHTTGDYWTPENPGAYFPVLSLNGGKNGASKVSSTRYLQNASYGRLKSLMFGYSLPKQLISKIGLQKLRVYVQGENLLTITPMKKWADPETLGNMTYPLQKKFTIGLNLTL